MLYLAGVAVGWATNAVDGYYGIAGVDVPPDAPGRLLVTEVAPGSPADRAGLRAGDLIEAVDGEPVAEALGPRPRGRRVPPSAAPAFRLRPLAAPPGDAPAFRRVTGEREPGEHRTLQIQRSGQVGNGSGTPPSEEIELTLGSRLAAPGVVVALLTWHIVGLLTLAVGLLVGLRRRTDTAARLLLVMGSCFALSLGLLSWNNRPLTAELALGLVQATVLLLVLGGASLLHLFLAFPAPHPLLIRLRSLGPVALRPIGGARGALYAVPFVLTLTLFLGPVVVWPWSYLVVTALAGLALAALTRSVVRPPSPIARAQLKWIAVALAIGLIALVLGPGVSVATGARVEVLSPTATVAAWALFPLAVGFAVMRYRLFDVDIVLRAAMFYPLLAALLAGGYLAAALALGRVAVAVSPGAADNPTIAVVAALLVAAVAHPVHGWLQMALDRLLYRDRIARQRLLEEARVALGQALSPEDVAGFLTGHVVKRLDLAASWLVLPSDVTASGGAVPGGLVRTSELLLERMRHSAGPTLLVTREEPASSGVSALLAEEPALAPWYAAGARLLLPLRAFPVKVDAAGDGLLGLWLVGLRRSGALLDTEDVEALSQVARQAAVLLGYDRLHQQQAGERQRTASFRRYFSPQIADLIAGERAELATHRRELTVLVAELRGLAALSETVEPEEVVNLLNDYFNAMTEVIFDQGGTIDKYLGDGVVAFFGDPMPQPDHAARAVRAALAMQYRLAELRQGRAVGRRPLAMGVGLATGWVTIGTIGSPARQEYMVVGDAANVAARLAATAGPGEVLVTEETRRLLGEDRPVVQRGDVSLPGRRRPVTVFAAAAERVGSAQVAGGESAPLAPRDRGDGPAAGSDMRAVAELLARTSLFASLPREELLGLASRLRVRRFAKGAMIVRIDEAERSLFLIRSGTVKVMRPLATGDEAVMSILGPGEFFGELGLLDGQGGTATVVALEAAEILVLSREDFLGYLQAYPPAAGAAIALLSERVRYLGDQLEEAYALELPQRLARRLLALGRTHGKKTPVGLAIDLPLTQSDLAGMVGASRQRVNRLLGEWQDRGLLRLGSHGTMVLLRPEIFAQLSQQLPEG